MSSKIIPCTIAAANTELRLYLVLLIAMYVCVDELKSCRIKVAIHWYMLIFYLLCYAAVLKFLTYYAQYYAHVFLNNCT